MAMESVEQRLDDAEEEQKQYLAFTDAQRAVSGCLVNVNRSGETAIHRGLQTQDDVIAAIALATDSDSDGAVRGVIESDVSPANESGLSQSLVNDLVSSQQHIIQAALCSEPSLAQDILLYSVATQVFGHRSWGDDNVMDLQVNARPQRAAEDAVVTTAESVLAEAESALNLGWLDLENSGESFTALRALCSKDKKHLMAYCVAVALRIGRVSTIEATAASDTTSALAIPFYSYWRPTAENYFSRMRIEQLKEHGKDWFGDAWLVTHASSKKSDLVDALHQLFHGDSAHLNEEQLRIRTERMPQSVERAG